MLVHYLFTVFHYPDFDPKGIIRCASFLARRSFSILVATSYSFKLNNYWSHNPFLSSNHGMNEVYKLALRLIHNEIKLLLIVFKYDNNSLFGHFIFT